LRRANRHGAAEGSPVRDLHVVGLSDDGRHLLLAGPAGRAAYRLCIDAGLESALKGEPPGRATEARVPPTPRVIQDELRAGASVEELAASAGVPVARIERFAGPVLSERARVLEALLGVPQQGRQGRSRLPLGEAVAAALDGQVGVRPESVRWTAFRPADGEWTARLTLVSRSRDRAAEWVWDPAEDCVRPRDRYAAGLAHVPAPPPRAAAVKKATKSAARTSRSTGTTTP
jgi:hypothetical protein